MDHYDDNDERLHQEMEEEIARVLDAVVDPPVRLVASQRPSWLPWRKPKTIYVLQRQVGSNVWEQIVPFGTC